ncbi:Uncharacterised protein [Bordetella pertussis]|nr:Uncharacterised protein [Bordetella pertussis]
MPAASSRRAKGEDGDFTGTSSCVLTAMPGVGTWPYGVEG